MFLGLWSVATGFEPRFPVCKTNALPTEPPRIKEKKEIKRLKTERDRERDMREREGGRESIISLNEYLELKKFFDSTAHVKSGDIDLVGKNRQRKC